MVVLLIHTHTQAPLFYCVSTRVRLHLMFPLVELFDRLQGSPTLRHFRSSGPLLPHQDLYGPFDESKLNGGGSRFIVEVCYLFGGGEGIKRNLANTFEMECSRPI